MKTHDPLPEAYAQLTGSLVLEVRTRHFTQVWVKVTEVRDDGGGPPKINCSMKAVSQEDGTDLDPDNTRGAARGAAWLSGTHD